MSGFDHCNGILVGHKAKIALSIDFSRFLKLTYPKTTRLISSFEATFEAFPLAENH